MLIVAQIVSKLRFRKEPHEHAAITQLDITDCKLAPEECVQFQRAFCDTL